METKQDNFKNVKLSQKEQIIEIISVSAVILLLLACIAKVLFL